VTFEQALGLTSRRPSLAGATPSTFSNGEIRCNYAYPGSVASWLRNVELAHVLAVLEPIWTEKTKPRLGCAGASNRCWIGPRREVSDGLNPARCAATSTSSLARPSKVADVEHHAALPFTEIGDFTLRLRDAKGMGARALSLPF